MSFRGALLVAALLLAATWAAPPASAASTRPPDITAPSAVLVDARDGHVLYRRAARARRPVASATKLMTALVSLEELPLRRRVPAAPYSAGAAESRINLRPGERMTVGDLLRALLLESANDAAVTLARAVSGSVDRFVEQMNRRARALGLTTTHFANPIGLDQPGNFSSALDLSRLTRRLLGNDTFGAIVDLPEARLSSGSRPRTVANRNTLVRRVPWIDGVKTGHTLGAGYVLVGFAKRKGARLVSVVLGSPSEGRRDSDTLALLNHGFSLYRRVRPLRAGATLATADVAFYSDRRVKLAASRDLSVAVRRGERVRKAVKAPGEVDGPLPRGARVGSVSVFRSGERVGLVSLVTAEPVPGAGFLRKVVYRLTRPGVLAIGVALVVLTALALRRLVPAKN
jgi:D-alanyl-D-alanine carboxypeptidase (penicillin-binding protein 5/6)